MFHVFITNVLFFSVLCYKYCPGIYGALAGVCDSTAVFEMLTHSDQYVPEVMQVFCAYIEYCGIYIYILQHRGHFSSTPGFQGRYNAEFKSSCTFLHTLDTTYGRHGGWASPELAR